MDTINSSKAKLNLIGQQYGEWTVLERLDKDYCLCRCSCGEVKKVGISHLRRGLSKSCGHLKGNKFIDLTGQQINEWTVLKYLGNQQWECKCSCGKVKVVNSYDLRHNKSKSCGHISDNQFKDISGQHFGEWTVLKYKGNQLWECQCSCGVIRDVDGRSLRYGATKSCGHLKPGDFIDLTGQKFGEWTALEYLGKHIWKCQCSCGTMREIPSLRLRSGVTKSCGCKQYENYQKTIQEKYGLDNISRKHLTPEQLEMTASKENLYNVILSHFNQYPTPKQLSYILGITPAQVMRVVRKYGLEQYIELDKPVSTYEDEINSIFPTNIRNNKTILNGKELDLYYPEQNLAIEFNGSYWHSEINVDSKYHQNKSIQAGKQGIRIIHIFEYEWNNPETKQKILSLIDKQLHPENNKVIYARQCNIKEIDSTTSNIFLDTWHLQAHINSSIQLGCYYNSELIGVMTFGKSRFDKNYEYELLRLCWSSNNVVVGGSEKLLKYFINKYKPKNIVTYCDISKFDANSYKRLGFKPLKITEPNYKWVKDSHVLSRYQTTKKNLIAKGLGTENETEDDIMYNLGFYKVYDCGNFKFEWLNIT